MLLSCCAFCLFLYLNSALSFLWISLCNKRREIDYTLIRSWPKPGMTYLFLYAFLHLLLDMLAVSQILSVRMLQPQNVIDKECRIGYGHRKILQCPRAIHYLILAILKYAKYPITSWIVRGQRFIIHLSKLDRSLHITLVSHYAIARKKELIYR